MKLLKENENILTTAEFILNQSPTNIKNVANHLPEDHTLLKTREFILVRSPTNVENVENFIRKYALFTNREIII